MIEAYKIKTLFAITALIHVSKGDHIYLYPQDVPIQIAVGRSIPLLHHKEPFANEVSSTKYYPYPQAESSVVIHSTTTAPYTESATISLFYPNTKTIEHDTNFPYPSAEPKHDPYPPAEPIILADPRISVSHSESTTKSLPTPDIKPIQHDINFSYPYPALEPVKSSIASPVSTATAKFPYPAEEPHLTPGFPYPVVEDKRPLVAPKIIEIYSLAEPKERFSSFPYPSADEPAIEFPYPTALPKAISTAQSLPYLPAEPKLFPYPAVEPKIVSSTESKTEATSYPYPSQNT